MDVPSGVNPSPVRAYLGVIQRRIGVIVVVVVVFTGIALAYTLQEKPVYQATSRVLLQNSVAEQILSQDAGSSVVNGDDTEIAVMQSQDVVNAVKQKLGHVPNVAIARLPNTNVVTVTASAGSPSDAANDANTYGQTYVDVRKQQISDNVLNATTQLQAKIQDLDNQLAVITAPLTDLDNQIATAPANQQAGLQARRQTLASQVQGEEQSISGRRTAYADQVDRLQLALSNTTTGGAQVIATAAQPTTPISPKPIRTGAIALGIAIVVGLGLAFLFEQLDDSIRSKTQLETVTGLTAVGLIPSVPEWRKGKTHEVVSIGAENSSAAEAYRSLRTSVQFMGIERPAQVIQITSALPAEGKTTTAANLAVALARAGKRVVMIDADLRRPRLNELFEMDGQVGLTTVLLGDSDLGHAIFAVPNERRLGLLTAGQVPPNPAELLVLRGFGEIIDSLRREADYIIIDTPPILPVSDARIVSALVDITLLVVAANASAEKDITRSIELLGQVDAKVAGIVLNNIPSKGRYSLSYGYFYGYGARPAPRLAKRKKRYSGPKPTLPKMDVEDVESRITSSD